MYDSKYFRPTEYGCKCYRCFGKAIPPLNERLIIVLDVIRAAIGEPVIINSGWRCSPHNVETKGASPTSYHLTGRAADITVKTRGRYKEFLGVTRRVAELFGAAEIKNYDTFVHIAFK